MIESPEIQPWTCTTKPKNGGTRPFRIQEPWRSRFVLTTYHRDNNNFHRYDLAAIESRLARVHLCVKERLDDATWQLKSHTKDALLLRIPSAIGSQLQRLLHIDNVHKAIKQRRIASVLRVICASLKREGWTERASGTRRLQFPLNEYISRDTTGWWRRRQSRALRSIL